MAFAQGGTEPKPKAEDYEVHARGKTVAIGAEYTIHSFSGQGAYSMMSSLAEGVYPPPATTS